MITILCKCGHHALQHKPGPLGPHMGGCSHLACGCDYYRPNPAPAIAAPKEAAA